MKHLLPFILASLSVALTARAHDESTTPASDLFGEYLFDFRLHRLQIFPGTNRPVQLLIETENLVIKTFNGRALLAA